MKKYGSRSYRNAGAAGPDWSRLRLTNYSDGFVGLDIRMSDAGWSILLNPEQVRDLAEQLSAIVPPVPPAPEPLISGDDFTADVG